MNAWPDFAVAACRCHMHLFNLCLELIMSFSFAKEVAVRAQSVATFIRASPIASAALAKACKAQKLNGTILSGNATRFTSVVRMLDSLQRLRPALTAAVDEEPSSFKPSVRSILNDRYSHVPVLISELCLLMLLSDFSNIQDSKGASCFPLQRFLGRPGRPAPKLAATCNCHNCHSGA